MKSSTRLPVLAVFTILGGCAMMPLPSSLPAAPTRFVVEEALAGHTSGHGTITPIVGDKSEFDVSINGTWNGKVLILVEDFKYPSGATERKTWRLVKTGPDAYVGTREDVIGQARAYRDGATLRLDYTVMLDTPLGKTAARFQDVLYWEDEKTIRNMATVSKIGLRLARVNLQLAHTD